MRSKRYFLTNIAAVCAFVLAVSPFARADVVTNSLGDRGDGKTLVRFSYSGSGGNSGTWTVPGGLTSVELLIVGGGSGGTVSSQNYSRSGGAGGAYTNLYSVMPNATLNVVVGVGGAGGPIEGGGGAAGTESSFGTGSTTVIAYGGGATLLSSGNDATHGNCGGYSLDNGATGPVNAYAGNDQAGGGAGGSPTGDLNATGGVGIVCAIISEAFATSNSLPYDQGYYGGGAGAVQQGGPGGLGGGGKGARDGTTTSGVDGLGGGGGGAGNNTHAGGDGGDGVIYIAYIPPPLGTVIILQ